MKWISVEDRLPEETAWVLAYPVGKRKKVDNVWFDGDKFCIHLGWTKINSPIVWMPLPDPPKDEAFCATCIAENCIFSAGDNDYCVEWSRK